MFSIPLWGGDWSAWNILFNSGGFTLTPNWQKARSMLSSSLLSDKESLELLNYCLIWRLCTRSMNVPVLSRPINVPIENIFGIIDTIWCHLQHSTVFVHLFGQNKHDVQFGLWTMLPFSVMFVAKVFPRIFAYTA